MERLLISCYGGAAAIRKTRFHSIDLRAAALSEFVPFPIQRAPPRISAGVADRIGTAAETQQYSL